MVAQTLAEIAAWYTEPTLGQERPVLLSKLAILELCGWIECELDLLMHVAEQGRLNDASWVEANLVNSTYGFHYKKHFRPMMAKLIGEIYVRRAETELETNHPGDLDRLTSELGRLWIIRCDLAHKFTDITVLPRYQAPSLTAQQHKDMTQLLARYNAALVSALAAV